MKPLPFFFFHWTFAFGVIIVCSPSFASFAYRLRRKHLFFLKVFDNNKQTFWPQCWEPYPAGTRTGCRVSQRKQHNLSPPSWNKRADTQTEARTSSLQSIFQSVCSKLKQSFSVICMPAWLIFLRHCYLLQSLKKIVETLTDTAYLVQPCDISHWVYSAIRSLLVSVGVVQWYFRRWWV